MKWSSLLSLQGWKGSPSWQGQRLLCSPAATEGEWSCSCSVYLCLFKHMQMFVSICITMALPWTPSFGSHKHVFHSVFFGKFFIKEFNALNQNSQYQEDTVYTTNNHLKSIFEKNNVTKYKNVYWTSLMYLAYLTVSDVSVIRCYWVWVYYCHLCSNITISHINQY